MMVLASLRGDAGIVDYLEQRARAQSVRGLVARTIVALALIIGGIGALPFGKSVVVTLASTYFAYAMWGLLDRARSYATSRGWPIATEGLQLLCALFVGIGVLSGMGVLLAIGFALLGAPWVL